MSGSTYGARSLPGHRSLNFENMLWQPGWDGNVLLPFLSGWQTSNWSNVVELGKETVYGGSDVNNVVLELENRSGDVSNLFTMLQVQRGSTVTLDFDLSARAGFGGADSAIKVMWKGQQIDLITPGNSFGWQHYHYDIQVDWGVQSVAGEKLELVAVGSNGAGAVIDNVTVSYAEPGFEIRTNSINAENLLPAGQQVAYVDMPRGSSWLTMDKLEVGKETVYGGSNANNAVIELEGAAGSRTNVFTNFYAEQGSTAHLYFDLSAREGFGGADSAVKVIWKGQEIDQITPGATFGWQNHHYALQVDSFDYHTNVQQELEIVAVNNNGVGALIDNLRVDYVFGFAA